jgi:hypothetical protein
LGRDLLTGVFLTAELETSNLIAGMKVGPDCLTDIQAVNRVVEKSAIPYLERWLG